MKSATRSLLIQIALLGAGIGMLFLAFRGQNLNVLLQEMKTADYRYVGLSLMALLAAHFLRALRWKMLILPIGFNPRAANVFAAVMIGYLANLAVPRMGEITRCAVLSRTDKAPVGKLLGTVITERIADVVMLMFLLILTFFLQFKLFTRFFNQEVLGRINIRGLGTTAIIIRILIPIIVAIAAGLFLYAKRKVLLNSGPLKKVRSFITSLLEGIISIRHMQHATLFLLYSLVIWFSMHFLPHRTLPYQPPYSFFVQAVWGWWPLFKAESGLITLW